MIAIILNFHVRPFDFFILANIIATCAVLAAYEPSSSSGASARNERLVSRERCCFGVLCCFIFVKVHLNRILMLCFSVLALL